jgi:hypothetical protein
LKPPAMIFYQNLSKTAIVRYFWPPPSLGWCAMTKNHYWVSCLSMFRPFLIKDTMLKCMQPSGAISPESNSGWKTLRAYFDRW